MALRVHYCRQLAVGASPRWRCRSLWSCQSRWCCCRDIVRRIVLVTEVVVVEAMVEFAAAGGGGWRWSVVSM